MIETNEGTRLAVRNTNRLESFSDGVSAVAITLLVLNMHIPAVSDETGLARALLQWPTYLSYFASFLMIGIIWANHHYLFTWIKRTDHGLLLINTIFLMSLVLIPFATDVLTTYPKLTAAALFYSAILFLTALLFNAIWWYALKDHRLVDKKLPNKLARAITRTYLWAPLLYLLSLVISLINVEASLLFDILTAFLYTWPADRLQRGKQLLRSAPIIGGGVWSGMTRSVLKSPRVAQRDR